MTNWDQLNTKRYYEEVNKIIDNTSQYGLSEDFHMHHIIPRCKGGLGDRKNNTFRRGSTHENCLYVTKQQHYDLHKILYEDNPNDWQLVKAFLCISDNLNKSREEFGNIIYRHSQETKEKFSLQKCGENNPMYGKEPWNKGLSWSEEIKSRISKKLSGENHPNYGKERPDETKEKISINSRGTKPNNKRVMCVETGEIYYSILEAIRQTGYCKIRDVLHGRRKSTNGTHWRFIEDGNISKEDG